MPGILSRSYSLDMIEKINFSHQVYIDQISDLLFPEPILDTYKTILTSEPEMPLDLWKGGKGMSHVHFGEEQVTASH